MDTNMDINKIIQDIMMSGPDRVVINDQAEAISSKRAREQHNITPDVIFIRDDGWSLAAPMGLIRVAYNTWPDQWTHVLFRGRQDPMTIEEFRTRVGEAHNGHTIIRR
jgi:hypothetical protein